MLFLLIMSNTLIVTGFMGAGKSTVGSKVAHHLEIPHYDTDKLMAEAGNNVPELVLNDMPRFRKLEAATLVKILGRHSGIITTGGGIVSTQPGREVLVNAGFRVPVVFLDIPFELAQLRVAEDTKNRRPLFDDLVTARTLYAERQTWYRETATNIVDASQTCEQVVNKVIGIALSSVLQIHHN